MQVMLSAFVGQNSSYYKLYYPIRGFKKEVGELSDEK